ncbi:MAG: transcription termination factor NusA [Candidatus Levybacteria bacterium RIFCSPHIGHO2_01_FULL_40_10]|nr:MAG: transcription termination factor NusA [Candidatus Levybacteria bacterium RIFCSPHIGHO2_01_FULL_40_10]
MAAVVQRSEFALALNQIASERGVDPSVVLATMKDAILAAYRKDNPIPEEEVESYTAELNENTGETKVLHDGRDVTPPGFGRIAAQTAKQVLLQKIREKEKDAVIAEYTKRIGTVVNGMILRFIGPNIIVDIGKAEAMVEPLDKISNEQYFLNKKMPVYIRGIDEEKREIMVSRAHPGLIEGLLRREVPEVASGSVTVKKVVREPGNRAKIAVYSEASGIDPVGSCVGQKGVRIQAVIDALDGLEKIDVIQWNPDPVKFITNALSPAKNLVVELDESGKIAKVKAPREELPLIIGREGQNVRLASKLTEYTIEVEGDDSMSPMETSGQAVPAEVSKEEKPTVEASEPEEKKVEEQEVPKTEEPAETLAPKEEGTEETVAETVVPQVTTEEPVAASPADSETEKIVEPVTPEETKPE